MRMFLNLFPLFPEIFILSMSCLILLRGVFSKSGAPQISFYLTQLTLLVTAVLSAHIFSAYEDSQVFIFHHMLVLDKLSTALTIFILIAMSITFIYARLYNE